MNDSTEIKVQKSLSSAEGWAGEVWRTESSALSSTLSQWYRNNHIYGRPGGSVGSLETF